MLDITIIYDNRSFRSDLQADWGFSCLIRCAGTSLLFDTGAKEDVLANNLSALGISPASIDALFLSHNHFDHVGGIGALLDKSRSLPCIIPAASKYKLGPKVMAKGGVPIYVQQRVEIAPHLWSTGEMNGCIREQSLLIEYGKELILVTGCAHPGILTVVEKVIHDCGRAPTLMIGGFHLYTTSLHLVRKHLYRLKKFGIRRIAPCHCTGEKAIDLFKAEWGNGYEEPTAGWTLQIA